MVVLLGIDASIGYDKILVSTMGRDDQAISPGLEFEQLMTFEVLHCIKGDFPFPCLLCSAY